jgi:hypothetical protein
VAAVLSSAAAGNGFDAAAQVTGGCAQRAGVDGRPDAGVVQGQGLQAMLRHAVAFASKTEMALTHSTP